jgi:predicted cobalt transporter CbtA
MKTFLFIFIVIASGAAAGLILGGLNLVFVEPSLDQAIEIENQHLFASGIEKDTPEFRAQYGDYRTWQKSGQVFAGGILGISLGSLFGIVFALSRISLPGKTDIKKSLILAGIMWLSIYFIPFLKYPANPPTVGDPETVVLRGILYLTFIAISGFGVVGFYKLSKKLKTRKFIAIAGYAAFIGIAFFAMPGNPDKITASMDLVDHFRMMSTFTVSLYWLSLGLIFGSLWNHYKPHKEITTSFN